MSLTIPVFSNKLSTCEEELNTLVYEIDWALKKSKQGSEAEISALKIALQEYKKKYDSCRAKLKDLVKKHEDLKVQFVSLDNSYQSQLAELQEEVTVLKSSFNNWWTDKQDSSRPEKTDQGSQTIAKLLEEVAEWSERARQLGAEKQEQSRQLHHLETDLSQLREQLSQCRTQMEDKEHTLASMSGDIATLADKAQERFLREEAHYQRSFTSSLDAKIQRFRQHLGSSS